MIKKNWREITAFIVLFWCLWNYRTVFTLLERTEKVLLPFIIGCSIAFVVNVLLEKLECVWRKLFSQRFAFAEKLKRPVCLAVSVSIICCVAALFMLTIVPELHRSLKALTQMLPPAVASFNVYLQQKIALWNLSADDVAYLQKEWQSAHDALLNFWLNNKGRLLTSTWNATTSLFDVAANFLIGTVFAFYLLLEKERVGRNCTRAVRAFLSVPNAEYLLKAAQTTKRIFTGFISGQISEAVILGCICFMGMLVLKLPYVVMISVLVAFMALIPIVGTIISAVVGSLLVLIAAPEKIWTFLIFFFILQRLEGDFLYPRVVGKAVGLSELWVLAAITVGGSLGGIIGMILSVPVCSVACVLFDEKVRLLLKNKGIDDITKG